MATISGMAFLKINGRSYESQGEFNVKIGGEKLSPVVMASGKVHSSAEFLPGMISGSIATIPGLDIETVKTARNSTIQVQAKSGHVYIMSDAFFSGEGEVSPKDGSFSIEFTGNPVKVVL